MSSYPPPPSKRVIKIGTVVGRINNMQDLDIDGKFYSLH